MINSTEKNMSELEKEIASVEIDAVDDEQQYADNNYSALDYELSIYESEIPYPNTHPYDVGQDYDDIERIQTEKAHNKRFWDKCEAQKNYCNNGSLYSGHLQMKDGTSFYIMDSPRVKSKLPNDYTKFYLINADDINFTSYLKAWRYPQKYTDVRFSRNVELNNRHVEDVSVIFDDGNPMFSNITDAYLRKALIKNKDKVGLKSIIQTIQEKQDNIRLLPCNTSFAVQGCAGSGKSMVVLHRIRFLLYGGDLSSDQFVFLVPSLTYKHFIKDILHEFRIPENRVLSYQEYYQIIGKKLKTPSLEDSNELVFDEDFLSYVYSKELIQNAYSHLFELVQCQAENLIESYDSILNKAIGDITTKRKIKLDKIRRDYLSDALTLTKPVSDFIPEHIKEIDTIPSFYESALYYLKEAKERFASLPSAEVNIEISDEDIRIVNNAEIQKIKSEIQTETNNIAHASVFTMQAHKNKLEKLKQKYINVLQTQKSIIAEEERTLRAEKIKQYTYVFDNITIDSLGEILTQLKDLIDNNKHDLEIAELELNSSQKDVGERFANEITLLNTLIDQSSELAETSDKYVNDLIPGLSYLQEILKCGSNLFASLVKSENEEMTDKIKERFKLFTEKTEAQTQAYLNTLLFNNCKKLIKDKFNITISKTYKHYWFLDLFCQYLTKSGAFEKSKYIFIDECQDLSQPEIELICKINTDSDAETNTNNKYPVLNVFGDINQKITQHGISDWSQLQMIPKHFELNENFRNTNQIIEYCNSELPFNMQKIGVDMDEVSIYQTVLDALKSGPSLSQKAVVIVKDEYSKKDFAEEYSLLGLKTDFVCYTVKEVKGLEFKEIFVVDRDMTVNEKYIAYTRALVKLNVVKTLDYYADRDEKLFNQGEDDEDEHT